GGWLQRLVCGNFASDSQVNLRIEQVRAERIHRAIRERLDLLSEIDHQSESRLTAQVRHGLVVHRTVPGGFVRRNDAGLKEDRVQRVSVGGEEAGELPRQLLVLGETRNLDVGAAVAEGAARRSGDAPVAGAV